MRCSSEDRAAAWGGTRPPHPPRRYEDGRPPHRGPSRRGAVASHRRPHDRGPRGRGRCRGVASGTGQWRGGAHSLGRGRRGRGSPDRSMRCAAPPDVRASGVARSRRVRDLVGRGPPATTHRTIASQGREPSEGAPLGRRFTHDRIGVHGPRMGWPSSTIHERQSIRGTWIHSLQAEPPISDATRTSGRGGGAPPPSRESRGRPHRRQAPLGPALERGWGLYPSLHR